MLKNRQDRIDNNGQSSLASTDQKTPARSSRKTPSRLFSPRVPQSASKIGLTPKADFRPFSPQIQRKSKLDTKMNYSSRGGLTTFRNETNPNTKSMITYTKPVSKKLNEI
jgi:hypothetical protein